MIASWYTLGEALKTNYILIDFENVQPKALTQLTDHPFKELVFLGVNQLKIPIELVRTLQPLGDNVTYIQVPGKGPDALDFHIAYYIGELRATDPNSFFHIISKDKGFDPLIEHLWARKIPVIRSTDITEIPMLRISSATSFEEQVAAVVKNLEGRGASRPRKDKTLSNTVKSMLSSDAKPEEIRLVIDDLKRQKIVVAKNGGITYNFAK